MSLVGNNVVIRRLGTRNALSTGVLKALNKMGTAVIAQGSVLGPHLFLLLYCTSFSVSNETEVHSFADYAAITPKNVDPDVALLKNRSRNHGIEINVQKSVHIKFECGRLQLTGGS